MSGGRFCAGLLLIAVAGTAFWVWRERVATYHFAEVQPGVLYRDGNRSMREFATACRNSGAKTVVMLVSDEEARQQPFAAEAAFCTSNGIRLVHIPVGLGKRPATADVQRFLTIAQDRGNQPVLVHCAQGVRRTGMMTAAYQRTAMGYDETKAKASVLLWGRRPERLDDVRGFIDDYDPVTRTVGSGHLIDVPGDAD
jgi:protein tyrosine phosphatase (PTP) superfamily phosphohydrolase (DUF442 family)